MFQLQPGSGEAAKKRYNRNPRADMNRDLDPSESYAESQAFMPYFHQRP
jgi:hypothetical protein